MENPKPQAAACSTLLLQHLQLTAGPPLDCHKESAVHNQSGYTDYLTM